MIVVYSVLLGTCAQAAEVVWSDIDKLKEKFKTLVDKITSFPVIKIEPGA